MKALPNISIPTPCHENWDDMTQAEQGRFCNACSKTVVDFSLMTNDEIIAHLNGSTGNVCGRFANTQLRPQRKISQRLKVFLYALFAVFLLQVNEPLHAQYQQESSQSVSGIIYGRVTDEKKQGLDFATVRVYEGGILKGGAKTDINGNYELKALAPGVYTVKVHYAGMDSVVIEQVPIGNASVRKVDIEMEKRLPSTRCVVGFIKWREPLVDPSEPGKKVMRKSDMKNLPIR